MSSQKSPQPRLMDIVRHVKPERALFTTFTLSLTWFEAYCLPQLQNYCDRVNLLVHANQAYKADEGLSGHGPGRFFRMTPVAMPKSSFFHPKIAYLQSPDAPDTLVVGSGNLTYPGQGGSLEVIDAVNSDKHPLVFEEFAAFIETLVVDRPEFLSETRESLLEYAIRARDVAAKATREVRAAPRTVWFVHTLQESAASQFSALVRHELPSAQELTVYSPYHTASGLALSQLAESCGVQSVRVGVALGTDGSDGSANNDPKFIAPFEPDGAYLPANLQYVSPKVSRKYSFAHAKTFEAAGHAERLLMTGSVNATSHSLCGTGNVEVALVRKLASSPFEWLTVQPDIFRPYKFEPQDEHGRCLPLDAAWREVTIAGRILGKVKAGTARFEVLGHAKALGEPITSTVDSDGSFSFTPGSDSGHASQALRLRVVGEDFEALGWLNVERELRFPPRARKLANAAANALNGQMTDRDAARMMEFLKRLPVKAPDNRPRDNGNGGGNGGKKKNPTTAWDKLEERLLMVLQQAGAEEWVPVVLNACAKAHLRKFNLSAELADGAIDFVSDTVRWLRAFASVDYSESNRQELRSLFAGMLACTYAASGNSELRVQQCKRIMERAAQEALTADQWFYLAHSALEGKVFAGVPSALRDLALDSALLLAEAPEPNERLRQMLLEDLGDLSRQTALKDDLYREVRVRLRNLRKNQGMTPSTKPLFGVFGPDCPEPTERTGCPVCNSSLGPNVGDLARYDAFVHVGCQTPVFVGLPRELLVTSGLPSSYYRYAKPRHV